MNGNNNFIDKWLSANIKEIIDCPHQPGNLKISKQACLKRLQASDVVRFEKKAQDDLFIFGVKQGLLKCKDCSVVNKSLKQSLEATFEPLGNSEVRMSFIRLKTNSY